MFSLTKNILVATFLILFSLASFGQKTVYKAKYVITNPFWDLEPKFAKAKPEISSDVIFGAENRVRLEGIYVEGIEKATGYVLHDFTRNQLINVYTKFNTHELKGSISEDLIKETKVPELIGDTTIYGYKCKIYKVTYTVGQKEGSKPFTNHMTYYVTEELQYPGEYKPLMENFFVPCVPIKGFLIKAAWKVVGYPTKANPNPAPRIKCFYYSNFSFTPIPASATALPFKTK